MPAHNEYPPLTTAPPSIAQTITDLVAAGELPNGQIQRRARRSTLAALTNSRSSTWTRSGCLCDGSGLFLTAPETSSGLIVSARFDTSVLVICPGCAAGKARAQAWCRLPAEAEGITLQGLKKIAHQLPALQAAAKLIRAGSGWLTLAGDYGTGKTTLIYAILNHLNERGIFGRYETAPDLLDYLRDGMQDIQGASPSARIRQLIEAPVLAVDEIDKYQATPFADTAIFRLFNARYQARNSQITLIGYNADRQHLVPPFLLSRTKDGRFQHIVLEGADIRPTLTDGTLDPWDRGESER